MSLDVYRSCTFVEKRQVLEAFWRRNVKTSARIGQATLQYGPYAVASMVVVALELIFIAAITIAHHSFILWIDLPVLAFTLYWTWWATLRWRVLRHTPLVPDTDDDLVGHPEGAL